MTSLFIKIKHRFPGIWNVTEKVNGKLFSFRYKDLKRITHDVLKEYKKEGFVYLPITQDDVESLIEFRNNQDNEYLIYFDPHPFNRTTLINLIENESYSLMKIVDEKTSSIVGYFFIRGFFIGKAFHGLITDKNYVNQGLGASMWRISMEICKQLGIKMYATVSKNNLPSLKSANNATEVRVAGKLENDFILIECQPKAVK